MVVMSEEKLVAKGPIFKVIKQRTEGLNIANDVKDLMVDYFERKMFDEIELICQWALDITLLQGKRTLQERDWEFILKKIDER